jgi:hypothetical protein
LGRKATETAGLFRLGKVVGVTKFGERLRLSRRPEFVNRTFPPGWASSL